jgi:hypothetical protein
VVKTKTRKGKSMEREELEQEINNIIEEEFGLDRCTFTDFDLVEIVEMLKEEGVLDWKFIEADGTLMSYVGIDDQHGYVFDIAELPDDLSRDDLIDFIIKIEEKYQTEKGKVKFDG